jgi:hypothetical protein
VFVVPTVMSNVPYLSTAARRPSMA